MPGQRWRSIRLCLSAWCLPPAASAHPGGPTRHWPQQQHPAILLATAAPGSALDDYPATRHRQCQNLSRYDSSSASTDLDDFISASTIINHVNDLSRKPYKEKMLDTSTKSVSYVQNNLRLTQWLIGLLIQMRHLNMPITCDTDLASQLKLSQVFPWYLTAWDEELLKVATGVVTNVLLQITFEVFNINIFIYMYSKTPSSTNLRVMIIQK